MSRYPVTAIFISLLACTFLQGSGTTENPSKHLSQIREAFGKLLHLVSSPQEPKGRPFLQLISKPSPCDKVAIVGAGLAGLHMAYLLKKQGYTNIIVLEKENRTGGKIMSVKHQGVYHELGACYLASNYKHSVIALAGELGIADDIFPQPPKLRALWLESLDIISRPLTVKQFIILELYKLTGVNNRFDAIKHFLNSAIRYTAIHREMFGKYQLGLMNRPSIEVLLKLKQPYLSFLRQNNLLALVPFFRFSQTLQGYGHMDSVPTLYGMIWNTPEFLLSAISAVVGGQTRSQMMFRHGFMQLTDKLAERADYVRLNVRIKEIQRSNNGIKILYQNKKIESFDYLIWAADAREALKVINDITPEEKKFNLLDNTWFTTTLFDSTEKCKTPLPVEVWVNNILQKRQHSVWSRRISKYALHGGHCVTTTGVKTSLSSVAYQLGSKLSSYYEIEKKFLEHFTSRVGAKDINVVKRKTWNYFPRFTVNDTVNGILWDVAEHQGAQKTWFIGSSVFFESTNNVINYNKLMKKRMQM